MIESHKEPGQKVTKALGVTNVEKGSRPHQQSVAVAVAIRTSRLRGDEQSGVGEGNRRQWKPFPIKELPGIQVCSHPAAAVNAHLPLPPPSTWSGCLWPYL